MTRADIEREGTLSDMETLRAEKRELQADNERLRVLVKDLADDLEAELNGRYPQNIRDYPSEQRRYERDMENVYAARRVLDDSLPTADDVRGIMREPKP